MLPEINDILFATDLSKNSDNALRYALSTARAYGAGVHVLHVTEPLSQDAIVTLQMFLQDDESRKKAIGDRHASVKEMLRKNQQDFVQLLPESEKQDYSVVKSVELVDGHSAEMILQRASELNCQLIVMGTHEQGTGHTFIGTVVKRVLRRSSIPTLIIPNTA
ncbi:universal stress protein [Ruegeria meonggei]|uniref:Universal stress protein family protein n=1 Tax=Ruegeria meonggei TaxID=1446476 RepID=A0A1X6ZX95_9RHOB|nr:universal stress protein [Ruegeria meonggei]SLN64193.1 Universal stress protein family protein [Ruegeria meonggei]